MNFAAVPGDDVSHGAAQRATSMQQYTIRAELDQTLAAGSQEKLAELIPDQQGTIRPNHGGGTDIQVDLFGHDIWQAILAAMVALTNANWTPISLHIAHRGPEENDETESA